MKKIISLFLALIMIFSLVSCAKVAEETLDEEKTEETEEKTSSENTVSGIHNADGVFAVGFSRQDITPTSPVTLAGYPGYKKRIFQSVKTKVTATCVAIRDTEGATHLLFTLDALSISGSTMKSVKSVVSPATKVPEENITVSCTHTHEAPSTSGSSTGVMAWQRILFQGIKNAANSAIADFDEAEIYENTINVPSLNFVRRVVTADGKVLSAGDTKTKAVDYETKVDDALQVLKFDRKNQPDIVLINWRAHPCFDGGEKATVLSADYIHYARTYVEEKLGVKCAYYQGAAGNIVSNCPLPANAPGFNGPAKKRDVKEYGDTVGENAVKALENMNKIEAGKVKFASKTVTVTVDHTEDGKYNTAKEVYDLVQASKIDEARALAETYGFDSIHHADSIVTKATSGKTQDIPISALSIGDAAFVFAPYEMFDITGMEIKSGSPFKHTFICELSNGSYSYFPAEKCFEKRGYEVCKFKYVKGTSEQLRDGFLELLRDLHA